MYKSMKFHSVLSRPLLQLLSALKSFRFGFFTCGGRRLVSTYIIYIVIYYYTRFFVIHDTLRVVVDDSG